jgi:N6-L-threonylcarbamoyladenine synthase
MRETKGKVTRLAATIKDALDASHGHDSGAWVSKISKALDEKQSAGSQISKELSGTFESLEDLDALLEADRPEFPFLALLVSGGHTQLMRVDAVGQYTLLGETLDDAAGEAFDKTAKLLGLGYPGGPAVSRLAEFGNPGVFDLPRPMLHSGNFDFSFAGLKTAVLTQVRKLNLTDSETCYQPRADLARAFVDAIVEVLVKKTLRAAREHGLKRIVVAGGVGANRQLREGLNAEGKKRGLRVYYPDLQFCTDNGAMIAFAGAMRLQADPAQVQDGYGYGVTPRWDLEDIRIRHA